MTRILGAVGSIFGLENPVQFRYGNHPAHILDRWVCGRQCYQLCLSSTLPGPLVSRFPR